MSSATIKVRRRRPRLFGVFGGIGGVPTGMVGCRRGAAASSVGGASGVPLGDVVRLWSFWAMISTLGGLLFSSSSSMWVMSIASSIGMVGTSDCKDGNRKGVGD